MKALLTVLNLCRTMQTRAIWHCIPFELYSLINLRYPNCILGLHDIQCNSSENCPAIKTAALRPWSIHPTYTWTTMFQLPTQSLDTKRKFGLLGHDLLHSRFHALTWCLQLLKPAVLLLCYSTKHLMNFEYELNWLCIGICVLVFGILMLSGWG